MFECVHLSRICDRTRQLEFVDILVVLRFSALRLSTYMFLNCLFMLGEFAARKIHLFVQSKRNLRLYHLPADRVVNAGGSWTHQDVHNWTRCACDEK